MSVGGGPGGMTTQLRDAAGNVDETIQDAQDQIDGVLKQASDIIVISAGVMFGVTFFVFAAAFIGWWRLLIRLTVILSLQRSVAGLLGGVVSIITVLVDDPRGDQDTPTTLSLRPGDLIPVWTQDGCGDDEHGVRDVF